MTSTTTTSITLSWTNPGDGDLSGVMIRRAAGSTPPSSPTSGTLVTQKSGTSHTDSGLSPSTQYAYAVFAYDEVPNYSTGVSTTGTTQAPDTTPPSPVTGLSVTGTTTTSITLSWTNPGDGDLAGVMIRRAPGGTPPSSPTSGTLVIQKSGTSHTDSGLSPGTQYAYAVFAYDEVPNYSTGATTTGTTQTPPPDTTPPGAVTGLSVTGATTTSITLSWTNPGDGDLAGVMIRRAPGSTPPSSPTSGTLVTQKSGTSHTDSGLSPGTQYAYAVFAYDEVPNYSTGATTTGTTSAATRHDATWPGHRRGCHQDGDDGEPDLVQPRSSRLRRRRHPARPGTDGADHADGRNGGQLVAAPGHLAHRHRAVARPRSTPTPSSPTTRCPTTPPPPR